MDNPTTIMNHRIVASCIIVFFSSFAAASSMQEYEALEKKAMAGDYQAQRNIAFWLTGGNNNAPPVNPILGCAWRLVIIKSGSTSVDSSDISNKQLYCDKRLDADARQAADAQATTLLKKIGNSPKK